MRNEVGLIAYADRLGGSLPALAGLLDGPLDGLFGGVHVLPFFVPYDGADAGYDPVDHTRVDRRLGTWDDVATLARGRDLVVDLIVNHVSAATAEFRQVVELGDAAPHAGMFLTFDRVFPAGATESDLAGIYRPRPGLPFSPMVLGDRPRLVWTTFTSRQIDIDVHDPASRAYLSRILRQLAASGVAMVRLDAIGYAVKTAGSSCFLTPETDAFIEDLTREVNGLGLGVLTEVHAPHRYAVELAAQVDRVYDFVLAPLLLHALLAGDERPLRDWLANRPHNTVTVLETHDGIAMVDAGPDYFAGRSGLLSAADLTELATTISRNSNGTAVAVETATGGLYRVDCTVYDALAADDRRYLLARLIQFCTPGIPQVYYVGLLAGRNVAHVAADTDSREINRRHYTAAQVEDALRRPVVAALLRLIRWRNGHPAFGGSFSLPAAPTGSLVLAWESGAAFVTLTAQPAAGTFSLAFSADGAVRTITDVADLP
ncbi:MAG TPA: alpha-amylase family glycosyl hydrolase [Mycobacteriales bacterium]|nr:alpha-amylase family glycosyl hydrolase [Mycobacteriales bacterium]